MLFSSCDSFSLEGLLLFEQIMASWDLQGLEANNVCLSKLLGKVLEPAWLQCCEAIVGDNPERLSVRKCHNVLISIGNLEKSMFSTE